MRLVRWPHKREQDEVWPAELEVDLQLQQLLVMLHLHRLRKVQWLGHTLMAEVVVV